MHFPHLRKMKAPTSSRAFAFLVSVLLSMSFLISVTLALLKYSMSEDISSLSNAQKFICVPSLQKGLPSDANG